MILKLSVCGLTLMSTALKYSSGLLFFRKFKYLSPRFPFFLFLLFFLCLFFPSFFSSLPPSLPPSLPSSFLSLLYSHGTLYNLDIFPFMKVSGAPISTSCAWLTLEKKGDSLVKMNKCLGGESHTLCELCVLGRITVCGVVS